MKATKMISKSKGKHGKNVIGLTQAQVFTYGEKRGKTPKNIVSPKINAEKRGKTPKSIVSPKIVGEFRYIKGKAVGTKPKLGTGKRFQALTKSLTGKGIKNPNALAASIGRKTHSAKVMTKLAVKGKK